MHRGHRRIWHPKSIGPPHWLCGRLNPRAPTRYTWSNPLLQWSHHLWHHNLLGPLFSLRRCRLSFFNGQFIESAFCFLYLLMSLSKVHWCFTILPAFFISLGFHVRILGHFGAKVLKTRILESLGLSAPAWPVLLCEQGQNRPGRPLQGSYRLVLPLLAQVLS
jgi:hypothetical protein